MPGLPFREEIRTLLVDDEEMAVHRLKKALEVYPHIKIIGEAGNGRSAVEMINTLRPDLVFLDIRMPEFNGLEVLNQLGYTPMIVFVTAYEEYAIKAFEKNSLDYLLKPVEDERLAITMKRIMEAPVNEAEILLKIKSLLSGKPTDEIISTIPVKTGNKITLVHVADVCFFEARDKYVYVHTHNAEQLIEWSLNYLEERLPPQFVRVHRGYIINKMKIREIHKFFKGTYIMVMDDAKASRIKSAYSYLEAVRSKILMV